MKYFHQILMASICLVSLTVSAQWQWTDKDGRKVYSDRAPPSDVPEKNIMKRPGNRVAAPAATDSSLNTPKAAPDMAAASAAQASASAPKLSGVEKELLEKKKKAEEAEVAKRKAEEERIVKAKVENCARAKQAKSNFDSGVRIAQTNAKGEREIMDDAARNAEVKRIQSIIDADCK
jgi:hypothetical protein